MLSTTSSILDTNADNHAEQSRYPLPSSTYLCNSCQISFQNGQEQRIHMKEPWQYVEIDTTTVQTSRIDIRTASTTSSGALRHYRRFPPMHSTNRSGKRLKSARHLPTREAAAAAVATRRSRTTRVSKAHRPSNVCSATWHLPATTPASPQTSSTCVQPTGCSSQTRRWW